MADKETKSNPKEEKSSTAKSSTAKTAATKSAAKTTATKPTEKPAKKTVAEKPVTKASAAAEKPATKTTAAKKEPTAESVVAKYSNRDRKSVVVEEEVPLKKAKKSEDAYVAAVVEKHTNSRGKKTSVVGELKARKTEERYIAIQDTPSSDGTATANTKKQTSILWILVGVLIAALLSGIILSAVMGALKSTVPYVNSYRGIQQVGFYSQDLGTTERVKPVSEIKDGGLSAYPTYGKTLSSVIGSDPDKVAARNALIRESSYLTATGTWNGGAGEYTWMDKDGKLYRGSTANPIPTVDGSNNQRQLYKHTASVGLYGGDVSDDEPGVIKQLTFRPRGYTRGYNVTGIYAPAGEVIKIEISAEDMEATGGIVIHIGQALYNGKANNIWAAKNQMQRFPVILNTMTVDKSTSVYNEDTDTYTAYVGSFVGGPLYIRNESVTFSVTVSGGVNYPHFILGYTTPEDFARISKSSAPYFDLEVWSYGVLHSGPKSQASGLSYDDLYKAAVLWEKVSLVTTTNSLQGIVFLYDPFVAAGAAVAFPGQGSVNCPTGWMRSSLSYNSIVAQGSWGNFHEYHHNFQGYGVGNGGEVTNNGMSLVSYALFTKVSSARGMSNYGAANLSGWNQYTSATWALEQTMRIAREGVSPDNGNQGLALYATLLHNFGPDNYIQAKVKQQRTSAYGENYAGYMQAWQDVTHYNMTYFFNEMLGGNVNPSLGNSEYPMFVPVSCVYQTGRGIKVGNNTDYIETMQPYVIPYGEDFTIDLRKYDSPGGQYAKGSIVLPDGFEYTVKNVSQPDHGKITDNGDGTYKFTPDKNMRSGKIKVTLGVTKTDNAFEVEDIDLILEFEQTHDKNKTVLERTIYTYDEGKAMDAFNNLISAEDKKWTDVKGFKTEEKINHSNPTQNCNTDIWFVTDNEAGHNRFPDALDFQIAKNNTISVIEGKLYAEEEGKYRVYLRGRLNCAVFYSTDGGKTYQLGAKITDEKVPNDSAYFRPNDENTYFDVDLGEKSWLYFKEVLLTQNASTSGTSYIGLGMKQWTKPMFTMREETDANGKTVIKYYDYRGVEVTEEEANNAQLIEPTVTKNSQPYVNAYRNSYEEVKSEFVADYFYTREYKYDYKDNELQNTEQTLVSTNYDKGKCWAGDWNSFKVENLTDGNKNTIIHTKDGWGTNDSRPIQFVIDMGEAKSVNRMIIYTSYRPNGDYHAAKTFKLEGSIDGETYTTIGDFADVPLVHANGVHTTTVDFDETTLRYYRITFTGSTSNLLIIAEIEMWHVFEANGAKMLSPVDNSVTFKGKWNTEQTLANYGYVMVGSRNANISFEFEGTRLGVLSSNKFGTNYEVFIDGHKMTSVPQLKPLNEQKDETGMSFLSEVLEEGKHTVTIKCKGEANFDSFVVYP